MQSIKSANTTCQQRRQQLETARSAKVARLHKDVQKIVKREMEFVKQVVEVIAPVSITWDEAAWNRVKDFIPIRVEVRNEEVSSKVDEADPEHDHDESP